MATQPKTLIAVVTARHREEWRQAIRTTWLPIVPSDKADVKFFMGTGEPRVFLENEIELNCNDTYLGLPEKIREITRWALKNGYEYMLKCDDDVVLKPKELLSCGYEQHLYSGKINRYLQEYNVPVGFNWWISKECINIIANSELPEDGSNDDEKWVASKLHEHGIDIHNDHRYEIYMGEVIVDRDNYPLHRPLRPPRINTVYTNDVFSWTIFLEANSGQTISTQKKIEEFYKVWHKLYPRPIRTAY